MNYCLRVVVALCTAATLVNRCVVADNIFPSYGLQQQQQFWGGPYNNIPINVPVRQGQPGRFGEVSGSAQNLNGLLPWERFQQAYNPFVPVRRTFPGGSVNYPSWNGFGQQSHAPTPLIHVENRGNVQWNPIARVLAREPKQDDHGQRDQLLKNETHVQNRTVQADHVRRVASVLNGTLQSRWNNTSKNASHPQLQPSGHVPTHGQQAQQVQQGHRAWQEHEQQQKQWEHTKQLEERERERQKEQQEHNKEIMQQRKEQVMEREEQKREQELEERKEQRERERELAQQREQQEKEHEEQKKEQEVEKRKEQREREKELAQQREQQEKEREEQKKEQEVEKRKEQREREKELAQQREQQQKEREEQKKEQEVEKRKEQREQERELAQQHEQQEKERRQQRMELEREREKEQREHEKEQEQQQRDKEQKEKERLKEEREHEREVALQRKQQEKERKEQEAQHEREKKQEADEARREQEKEEHRNTLEHQRQQEEQLQQKQQDQQRQQLQQTQQKQQQGWQSGTFGYRDSDFMVARRTFPGGSVTFPIYNADHVQHIRIDEAVRHAPHRNPWSPWAPVLQQSQPWQQHWNPNVNVVPAARTAGNPPRHSAPGNLPWGVPRNQEQQHLPWLQNGRGHVAYPGGNVVFPVYHSERAYNDFANREHYERNEHEQRRNPVHTVVHSGDNGGQQDRKQEEVGHWINGFEQPQQHQQWEQNRQREPVNADRHRERGQQSQQQEQHQQFFHQAVEQRVHEQYQRWQQDKQREQHESSGRHVQGQHPQQHDQGQRQQHRPHQQQEEQPQQNQQHQQWWGSQQPEQQQQAEQHGQYHYHEQADQQQQLHDDRWRRRHQQQQWEQPEQNQQRQRWQHNQHLQQHQQAEQSEQPQQRQQVEQRQQQQMLPGFLPHEVSHWQTSNQREQNQRQQQHQRWQHDQQHQQDEQAQQRQQAEQRQQQQQTEPRFPSREIGQRLASNHHEENQRHQQRQQDQQREQHEHFEQPEQRQQSDKWENESWTRNEQHRQRQDNQRQDAQQSHQQQQTQQVEHNERHEEQRQQTQQQQLHQRQQGQQQPQQEQPQQQQGHWQVPAATPIHLNHNQWWNPAVPEVHNAQTPTNIQHGVERHLAHVQQVQQHHMNQGIAHLPLVHTAYPGGSIGTGVINPWNVAGHHQPHQQTIQFPVNHVPVLGNQEAPHMQIHNQQSARMQHVDVQERYHHGGSATHDMIGHGPRGGIVMNQTVSGRHVNMSVASGSTHGGQHVNSTVFEHVLQRNVSKNVSLIESSRNETTTLGNGHNSSAANTAVSQQGVGIQGFERPSNVSRSSKLNQTTVINHTTHQVVPRVEIWSPNGGNVRSTTQIYQRGRAVQRVNVTETFAIITRVHRFDGDSLNVHYEISNTSSRSGHLEFHSAHQTSQHQFTHHGNVEAQSPGFRAVDGVGYLRELSERINNSFVRYKPEIEVDVGKGGGKVAVSTQVYQDGQRATETGVRRDGEFVVVTRVRDLGDADLRVRYHFRRL